LPRIPADYALWLEFYGQVNLMLPALTFCRPAARRRPYPQGAVGAALGLGQGDVGGGWLGKLLAVLLAAFAVAGLWQGGTVNLTFAIAAVWLFAGARAETAAVGFRVIRILARKKAELTARGVMPTVHITLGIPRASEIVRLFGPEQYYIVLVVDGDCRLRGALTETEVWEGWPGRGFAARIGDFL
jgi:stage IV sporulation protein FB